MSAAAAGAAPGAGAGTSAAPPAAVRGRLWRAAGWLLGGNLVSQALRLASNLLLTRWLAPDAFGLIAAVHTLYFALVMVSDLGLWQSVVRSPRGEDPRFLGTVAALQLLRGALLALAVLAAAAGLQVAGAAGWFGAGTLAADPRLSWLVAAFALCALVQGAESTRLASAQRAMRAGALARLELLSQLVAMGVTLAMAWSTRSVAALAAGVLAGAIARTLLTHCTLGGPGARPCWDRDSLRELLGFGRWTLLSSLIGFVAAHGEKLILATLLAAASFGLFSIASLLLAAAVGVYGALNGQLVFARLSEAARHGSAEIGPLLQRVQRVADWALAGLAGVLLFTAPWIVQLLYDERYRDAGWMLQALALGLVALRHQVTEQLMFAQGRPARVSASNALRALALLALVPAAHALGGERGAVAAVVLSQFAGWPNAWHFLHRQGLWRPRAEARWMFALAAGALAGAAFDALLQRALG